MTQLVNENQAFRAKLKESGIKIESISFAKAEYTNSICSESTQENSSQSIESEKVRSCESRGNFKGI
jgi:hypothetical protein